MNSVAPTEAETAARSYLDWWREVGVDIIASAEPHNWLANPSQPAPSGEGPSKTPPTEPPAPTKRHSNVAEKAKTVDAGEWPSSVDALVKALKDKAPLPGNQYGGNVAVPLTTAKPKILVIGDIPEAHDIESGRMGAGPAGDLVRRMMQAIGIASDEYVCTALATTRPATGALPDSDLAMLAEFMLHQIGLIKPEKTIIFGSAACQALLGADIMEKRGNLHYFNHNVHKVAAVTTFHPRTLLARPQMKGQAWKDLQVLIK